MQEELKALVQAVRDRADVPRVRSREIQRIIKAYGDLIREGAAPVPVPTTA